MTLFKPAFAVVFALLITTCAFAQTQDGPIEDELHLRVVNRLYGDISEKSRWELKVGYPEVRMVGDIAAAKFNKLAKQLVMEGLSDFRKQMSNLSAEEIDHLPEDANFYYETGYTVEYLSNRFVSINFGSSEYTGGAHPNHASFTLNYDLVKERELGLENLFKPETGYLSIISKISIDQIKKDQGVDGPNDWIEDGAGPKLDNFRNWNITKKGLKFTFEPYVVGPYASGTIEILIPFEKFNAETRQGDFVKIVSSVIDSQDDRFMCRNGLFTTYQGAFTIGTVKMAKGEKISRSYFYEDSDTCPDGDNCRLKSYVVSRDSLIIAEEKNGFYCAWYQPKKGNETVGWIRKHELNITSPDPAPDLAKWLGDWESNGNSLKLTKTDRAGGIKVTGNAFWRGLGDNIHIGEVDDERSPQGNRLNVGGEDQYDCRVKMTLFKELLIVSDNRMCGGVNVAFDGVYKKR